MAFDLHKNFATSAVGVAPSPATSGTTLTVTAGTQTWFPTVPFNAVVCPDGARATPDNAEVVRVTARTGGTLTIVRAQEGSTARSIVVGDRIFAGATAKTLTDIEDELISETLVDAKGDLLVGSASDTVVRKAVGVDGSVLTARASGAGGVGWEVHSATLFDHYTLVGNVGTGEDTLISDTIPANTLSADGAKLYARFAGNTTAHASRSRQLRVKFGAAGSEATMVDTSPQVTTGGASWVCNVFLIRSSSSVVQRHVQVEIMVTGGGNIPLRFESVASVTSLDFTGALNLIITGEISAGSNDDITVRNGVVRYEAPAL